MVRRKRLIFASGVAVVLAAVLISVANMVVGLETLRQFEEVGVIILLVLLLGLVIYFWWCLGRSLRRIRDQLNHFQSDNRIGMILVDEDDELAELVGSINSHLTRVKEQFEHKRIQKRELQLQAQVAETERQQIEAIIFSLSEAVLVTDSYDDLLLANQAAETLFGFRFNPTKRFPIDQVLGDSELLSLIRQTRESKSRRTTQILERSDAQADKVLSLKVLLSCVFGNEQEVLGVVVVIHDMTAEQEVARLKDEFFNDVSHELKTPLACICAYAEMLSDQSEAMNPDYQDFGKIIQEQGRRLSRLVEDILDVSRIESGVLEANRQRVDLVEVMADVARSMQPQAQAKEIRLQCETGEGQLWVEADAKMIYHAILNLVSNAVKYSAPQREVTLRGRYEADGEAIVVEVEDEGIGIPEEYYEQIFEKFYRVDQHKEFASGSGVGLNLVKRIVEDFHNGTITVISHVGQGSRFRMTLPVSEMKSVASL